MNRIEAGMVVLALDDRRLGTIRNIRPCCFEIQIDSTTERVYLAKDAIFNIDMRVTLICLRSDIARYRCRIHHPDVVGAGT